MSAALREERGDGVSGADHQRVAILERQAGCRNWRAKAHADLDRTDDQASLPHRVTRAIDRDRHDRRLPLNRHDEAALLERQQLPGAAPRALGENQERVPLAQRAGRALDRRQALVAIAALERDEPGEIEGAHENRQLAQLRLVENAEARKELA